MSNGQQKKCKMTMNIHEDRTMEKNAKSNHTCSLSDHLAQKCVTKLDPTNEQEIISFIKSKLARPAPSVYEEFIRTKRQEMGSEEAGRLLPTQKTFMKIFYEKRLEVFPDKRHL